MKDESQTSISVHLSPNVFTMTTASHLKKNKICLPDDWSYTLAEGECLLR